jgi:hypothetical protein
MTTAATPAPAGLRVEPAIQQTVDRLTPQTRPGGPVIGYQRWHSVLFLHWALPVEALRRHVPRRLRLDTYDGEAWLTAALLTVTGARLRPFPVVPGLSSFHEVNLRTYVHLDGKDPGVWFFSLDATSLLACGLARAALRLPYFFARARRSQVRDEHRFESTRVKLGKPPAEIAASWRSIGALLEATPGSLEHFLTQRFFIYSPSAAGRLWREQVHHAPWPLFPAELVEVRQSLDEAHQLPFLPKRPLAHYSPGVDVEYFPPHLV